MSRMPPKGSRGWRTCLPRISSTAAVTLGVALSALRMLGAAL